MDHCAVVLWSLQLLTYCGRSCCQSAVVTAVGTVFTIVTPDRSFLFRRCIQLTRDVFVCGRQDRNETGSCH